MYRYTEFDRQIVRERVAQFRDQTRRYLAGELSEDDFRPLRLQNGLYVQRHAPMLRIAIPYGTLSAVQLRALAASWPLGAEGVALLTAWPQAEVQAWLAASLPLLRSYKQAQQALCTALGWQVLPGSLANFFTARVPTAQASSLAQALQQLRQQGIKLRDATSFGLPGHVRLGVLPPPAQQALRHAWEHLSCTPLH